MEKKQMSLGAIFVFGVLFLLISIKDLGYVFTGEATNINDLSRGEIKVGKHVEAELYYCVDWYAELTTRGSRGRRTVTWHAVGVLEDGSLVSICTKRATNEYYKIEDFIKASQRYLSGETDVPPEPIVVSGTVRKIDSEIREYYDSAVWLLQYDSDDVIYFDIDTSQKRIYYILVFVVSLIMIIVPTLAFVAEYNESKKKRIERLNDIPQNHYNDDPIFNNKFYETHKISEDSQTIENKVMGNNDNETLGSAIDDENMKSSDENKTSLYSGKFKLKED
ncbi:MAG: hypothetical protein IKJ73_07915 [Lachnospiraceae bacterium]|nr:hypothetical protein [Lachnospiraceae bacterium]